MPEYYEEMPLAESPYELGTLSGEQRREQELHGIVFKAGCEAQRQLAIAQGWIKVFPRSDSELISRERAESATGTCWCNNIPFTDAEKEDITRYIIQGAEIQRDHMVMQGWRKIPSEDWLTNFLKPVENNRVDARDVAKALLKEILKGSRTRKRAFGILLPQTED